MLDTYDNLKLEIIKWGERGTSFDLDIDTFIDIAETEMLANPIEILKLRGQETRSVITTNTTDRFAALPTDYLSTRKLRIQIDGSYEIFYRTPAQLNILSTTGMPCFFTVTDQIEFDRVSDQVYTGEAQIYTGFTPLSENNTTNTVLTNFPTVYFFGAMWALKIRAEELPEADSYYSKFISAIKGANKNARMGRYGPAPVMRVEGSTP